MERARGDKEDMVCLYAAVFGANGRPFDKRKEIALDTLARYARAALVIAVRNLVYLVDKYDTSLLSEFDGAGFYFFVIN